jgi:hypothetical protein
MVEGLQYVLREFERGFLAELRMLSHCVVDELDSLVIARHVFDSGGHQAFLACG